MNSPSISPTNPDIENNKNQATCSTKGGEVSRFRGFDHSFTEKNSRRSMMKNSRMKFHSKSMPRGSVFLDQDRSRNFQNLRDQDQRYDLFRTFSVKLEGQISSLPKEGSSLQSNREVINGGLTVDRFFDALQGPELETLRDSEEILLPDDKKWPFLLRFPITSFGMCLGISSQAIMWKTLATTEAEKFLNVTQMTNHALWWISLFLLLAFSSAYILKAFLYFEAVRREFQHPIRVNFFFAPLISTLFLALGIPHSIVSDLPKILWYILMAPILCLELKIYGQWMSGGQRRLSKVANPTNHLSIVGNFVGALLGASMGLKEGPIFFFAIGMSHYLVLFVTLYQRLPTNETLPKELHPVFFLFVAAPAVASMAWTKISGSFDLGSRFAYFISLFLYFSLVVRVNFFRGFKFTLAWWAYTFPMTAAATAAIKYSGEVAGVPTQILSVLLSGAATLTVIGVFVMTMMHAFVLRDLFPNDIAIAISVEQPKQRRWFKQFNDTSLRKIGNYLKVLDSNDNKADVEAPPVRKIEEYGSRVN
ncbi:PREDICTED: S-type anion channel SLAH2 [Tarenaya hassleriana]|uniref:S-type anion channel SLAH2 n=1 Tax=Tarenaya hassleriana TaxID=28532 RepID=UPI00053C73E8|nr:PREDICTED: S-type anion channel SLAH2 [Tarenaya hassleriana]